jgi:hypothetical protein
LKIDEPTRNVLKALLALYVKVIVRKILGCKSIYRSHVGATCKIDCPKNPWLQQIHFSISSISNWVLEKRGQWMSNKFKVNRFGVLQVSRALIDVSLLVISLNLGGWLICLRKINFLWRQNIFYLYLSYISFC